MTAEPPHHRPWEVVALGTGGAGADAARGYPCLLLKVGGHRTLIDAGDGTFRQLARWDSARRLDLIVLTALTTERVGGLATILDDPVLGATRPPPLVVGPAGTAAALRGMTEFMTEGRQISEVVEVEDEKEIPIGDTTAVIAVVDIGQSGTALGLRLTEPDASGRFDVEAAKRLGIEPGPAFGLLQRGESVDGVKPAQIIGPPRAGRRLAVLGPCRPTARAARQARHALALFVVAPYTEERQEVAVETGVMTGVEAALFATQAEAHTLALMHLGGVTRHGYARREAAQFHRRVLVPFDGDHFVVPLQDIGPVEHTRAATGRFGGTRSPKIA